MWHLISSLCGERLWVKSMTRNDYEVNRAEEIVEPSKKGYLLVCVFVRSPFRGRRQINLPAVRNECRSKEEGSPHLVHDLSAARQLVQIIRKVTVNFHDKWRAIFHDIWRIGAGWPSHSSPGISRHDSVTPNNLETLSRCPLLLEPCFCPSRRVQR
jgi:hypothetical protein